MSRLSTFRGTVEEDFHNSEIFKVPTMRTWNLTNGQWLVQWLRLDLSSGPNRVGVSQNPHLGAETDLGSEMLFFCFLDCRTIDKVNKNRNLESLWFVSRFI
jgi:hypothetical protein